MTRFVTFTSYSDDYTRCMTEEEYTAEGLPDDYCDFIWQHADSREAAVRQHVTKLGKRERWLNEGGPEKATY